MSIFPDSEIIILQKLDNNDDQVNILSIYRTNPKSGIFVENIGFWRDKNGISYTNNKYVSSRRRRNLQGTHLKSCLVVNIIRLIL